MKIKLFRTINSGSWAGSYAMPKVLDMKNIVSQTIKQACGRNFENITFSLSIVFVNNEEIRKYNKEYRNVDKATDVLSFPEFDFASMKWEDVIPSSKVCYLGDIMLSHERVLADCAEMMWKANERVLHLIAHSVLHLLGFDHVEDNERLSMEAIERAVMRKMGFQDPYE